jgi:hypothetical protein
MSFHCELSILPGTLNFHALHSFLLTLSQKKVLTSSINYVLGCLFRDLLILLSLLICGRLFSGHAHNDTRVASAIKKIIFLFLYSGTLAHNGPEVSQGMESHRYKETALEQGQRPEFLKRNKDTSFVPLNPHFPVTNKILYIPHTNRRLLPVLARTNNQLRIHS